MKFEVEAASPLLLNFGHSAAKAATASRPASATHAAAPSCFQCLSSSIFPSLKYIFMHLCDVECSTLRLVPFSVPPPSLHRRRFAVHSENSAVCKFDFETDVEGIRYYLPCARNVAT